MVGRENNQTLYRLPYSGFVEFPSATALWLLNWSQPWGGVTDICGPLQSFAIVPYSIPIAT